MRAIFRGSKGQATLCGFGIWGSKEQSPLTPHLRFFTKTYDIVMLLYPVV